MFKVVKYNRGKKTQIRPKGIWNVQVVGEGLVTGCNFKYSSQKGFTEKVVPEQRGEAGEGISQKEEGMVTAKFLM